MKDSDEENLLIMFDCSLFLVCVLPRRNLGGGSQAHCALVLQSYARVQLNLQEAAPTDTGTCARGERGAVSGVGGLSGGGWRGGPKWVLAEASCLCG